MERDLVLRVHAIRILRARQEAFRRASRVRAFEAQKAAEQERRRVFEAQALATRTGLFASAAAVAVNDVQNALDRIAAARHAIDQADVRLRRLEIVLERARAAWHEAVAVCTRLERRQTEVVSHFERAGRSATDRAAERADE